MSDTIADCVKKLWETNTIEGQCASLDAMKHLSLMGYQFDDAENAYYVAMNEQDSIIREAALQLLAALLIKQQRGVLCARQLLFNVRLYPENETIKNDAITLFESMIDHCQLKSNVVTPLTLPPLNFSKWNYKYIIGGLVATAVLFKITGYKLCIHKD